jgi:hypothetical protein
MSRIFPYSIRTSQMMDDRTRRQRIARALAQERTEGKLNWWWLSFADPRKPKGQQFLGACLVQGYGLGTAIQEARRRGINPGGEVKGSAVQEKSLARYPENAFNRFMDLPTIERILGPVRRM